MLEELKNDEIVNKVGGRFKLSALIQKRLVFLNHGAAPLVDAKTDDKFKIVIQEILQDKIYLDMENNLRITGQEEIPALPDLPSPPIDMDMNLGDNASE